MQEAYAAQAPAAELLIYYLRRSLFAEQQSTLAAVACTSKADTLYVFNNQWCLTCYELLIVPTDRNSTRRLHESLGHTGNPIDPVAATHAGDPANTTIRGMLTCVASNLRLLLLTAASVAVAFVICRR